MPAHESVFLPSACPDESCVSNDSLTSSYNLAKRNVREVPRMPV